MFSVSTTSPWLTKPSLSSKPGFWALWNWVRRNKASDLEFWNQHRMSCATSGGAAAALVFSSGNFLVSGCKICDRLWMSYEPHIRKCSVAYRFESRPYVSQVPTQLLQDSLTERNLFIVFWLRLNDAAITERGSTSGRIFALHDDPTTIVSVSCLNLSSPQKLNQNDELTHSCL